MLRRCMLLRIHRSGLTGSRGSDDFAKFLYLGERVEARTVAGVVLGALPITEFADAVLLSVVEGVVSTENMVITMDGELDHDMSICAIRHLPV